MPAARPPILSLVKLPPAPPPSSPTARKVMLGNRRESAKERALRGALHACGERFRKDYAPLPGLRCKADVAFTRERLAIFVDGCFWHRCPEHGSAPKANSDYWRPKLDANVARDRRNDQALREAGWTVLRLWEHDSTSAMASIALETLRALRSGAPSRTRRSQDPPCRNLGSSGDRAVGGACGGEPPCGPSA